MSKGFQVVLLALLAVCAFAFVINPIAHYITGTLANAQAKMGN